MQYMRYMEKVRNFLGNITQAGWIVISLVILLVALVLTGFLLSRGGVNVWPFVSNEASESEINEISLEDSDFVEEAVQTAISVDDVLNGDYGNSVAAAAVFVQNTVPVQVAVISDQKFDVPIAESNDCGNVIFATTRVPKKPAILNESLVALFGGKVATDVMPGNVISNNVDLLFERAVIENGEALISLNGTFAPGECNQANVLSQIKYTALNFDSVNSVAVFLNGTELE